MHFQALKEIEFTFFQYSKILKSMVFAQTFKLKKEKSFRRLAFPNK